MIDALMPATTAPILTTGRHRAYARAVEMLNARNVLLGTTVVIIIAVAIGLIYG
jgi:hypothetical protein